MASSVISRTDGLVGEFGIKAPVRAASTASLTLAGEQTIDGVAVSQHAGTSQPPDRVLVKDQSDQTTNGIYAVQQGAWLRAADFDGPGDAAKGTQVLVTDGSINAGAVFKVTSANPIQIDGAGASNITFSAVAGNDGSTTTTIAGSVSGSAVVKEGVGAVREVTVVLKAYRSTAKAYTFLTAFGLTPVIFPNSDPVATVNTTTLTLPDTSAAAISGIIVIKGGT